MIIQCKEIKFNVKWYACILFFLYFPHDIDLLRMVVCGDKEHSGKIQILIAKPEIRTNIQFQNFNLKT